MICVKVPTYPGEFEWLHYVTCGANECDCPSCDRPEIEMEEAELG